MNLGRVLVGALAAACGGGLVFGIALAFDLGEDLGLLCIAGTLALAVAAVPLFVNRRFDPVEPLPLMLIVVAFGITGKAFYIALGPEERVRSFLLLGAEPRELLFPALVMVAALACFSTGYLSGHIRWRIPAPAVVHPAPSTRRFVAVVGILLAVGLLSSVVFASRFDVDPTDLSSLSSKRFQEVEGSEIKSAQGYLRTGAVLLEIAFYLVFARWASRSGRLWSTQGAWVLFVTLLAVAFPFFVSSRQSILLIAVRAILIWICLRGAPRARWLVAAAVVSVLALGSMLALRRGVSDWEDFRANAGVGGILESTVGGRYFLDLSKTARILRAVPAERGFEYGRTLVTWVAAPVPRSVWPEKPPLGVGVELGPELFGSPPGSGVPPGVVAELYLNFGLFGVAVGMLALGLLLRSLYTSFRPHFPHQGAVLLYALLVTRVALDLVTQAIGMGIIQAIQELLPLVAALWAFALPEPSAAEATGYTPATGAR